MFVKLDVTLDLVAVSVTLTVVFEVSFDMTGVTLCLAGTSVTFGVVLFVTLDVETLTDVTLWVLLVTVRVLVV